MTDQPPIHRWTKVLPFIRALAIIHVILTAAIYAVTKSDTPGIDFYVYYSAGRNILVEHVSPYDDSVGENSQKAILRRSATGSEDQLHFANPPYALLPILPLVHLPFRLAQAIWMATNFILLFCSFSFAIPNSPRWLASTALILYPIFFGFLLGNLDIWIISLIFLLFGRLPTVSPNRLMEQILFGIILAWLTIKPQFTGFFILFFLLVAYRRNLKAVFYSFAGGLIGLLLVNWILVPNWISEWINRILLYPTYTGGEIAVTALLRLFLAPEHFIYVYGFCLAVGMIVLFRMGMKWFNGSVSSLEFLTFGCFFTFFFHPHGNSYEQLIFLIPVILWIILLSIRDNKSALLFWLGLSIISWLFFFIGRILGYSIAVSHGLYITFILWMIPGVFLPPRFIHQFELLKK
jgi:hypothetical protein